MSYGPKPPFWIEPPYESDYAAEAEAYFESLESTVTPNTHEPVEVEKPKPE